jgi:hypothetical protein
MEIIFLPIERHYDLEAGMLIKRKTGEIELVGHINKNEGYCDCCSYGEIIEYSTSIMEHINALIAFENSKTGFIPK